MAVVKRRPVPKTGDAMDKKRMSEITDERENVDDESEVIREKRRCPRTSDVINETKITEHIHQEEVMNNTVIENRNYDLEGFQPSLSKSTNRFNSEAGAISIINSSCGKRVTISAKVMDRLNNPAKISISFSDESIAIGETLPNNTNQLIVKITGKKGIIYSAGIVNEITNLYGLDFSNRTSITFLDVEYIESQGFTVAIINTR